MDTQNIFAIEKKNFSSWNFFIDIWSEEMVFSFFSNENEKKVGFFKNAFQVFLSRKQWK